MLVLQLQASPWLADASTRLGQPLWRVLAVNAARGCVWSFATKLGFIKSTVRSAFSDAFWDGGVVLGMAAFVLALVRVQMDWMYCDFFGQSVHRLAALQCAKFGQLRACFFRMI